MSNEMNGAANNVVNNTALSAGARRRRAAADARVIRAYWAEHGIRRGMDDRVYENVVDSDTACFCCGREYRALERAHIIPHAMGGSVGPDNLLLLCAECHADSPDVALPGVLIQWMTKQVLALAALKASHIYGKR